ncbi:serine/threonine protein kinase [Paenibacillus urinalis]|uniref:Serine/threonine protein kinase n=1 Tax=Paenibacillus urinalis TaxID=521520 RepID=A0ABY7XA67_9BACL|nr:serine/threonine protein kinase [Paenibacillus urinalis]WDH96911.1 serine/threonine protein kinase [Paenibacillus urinalis]WDI00555.1 serine/threonine protein kinase [Paenibacillus urinalis]
MSSPIIYQIDQVSFCLKEHLDFSWLSQLGTVFTVFDQQDSGNISFGVERAGENRFVKFAGARTMEYEGDPQHAVTKLVEAASLYKELQHPVLVELIDHYEVASGYVAIFKWFDGECLHSHWAYPPPAKYTDLDSPFYRFKQLSIEHRLQSLNRIFDFHVFVEEKGYVAIDFYDGSLLYDFVNGETKICDIDYYEKKPFYNQMGRLWGSSRFMSPEEFELGAEIDSRTNVYTMGATAFVLLGGELDRSFEIWDASEALYKVARKATSQDSHERYSSVKEFYKAWNEALDE